MISAKKFVEMARLGQKIAATGRRRISLLRTEGYAADSSGSTTSAADKGHFVAYTVDGMRFVIPLAYLSSSIIQELFKMSEDEFGLPSGGPITLPCDAVSMNYAITLIQRSVSEDVERAFVASIATCRCSPSSLQHEGLTDQQPILLPGF